MVDMTVLRPRVDTPVHPSETPSSLSSSPRLSRGAKGLIAALSAVVTLATGVISLRDQLLPAHPPTAAAQPSERHEAESRTASPVATASAAGRTQPAATSASSTPGGVTNCGAGLNAGPNTSCPFARNVRDAYDAAPGATASVRVFSPVTGQAYTMSCAAAGSGVTCSGANNASVTWSR
jgi:hypothetical protein